MCPVLKRALLTLITPVMLSPPGCRRAGELVRVGRWAPSRPSPSSAMRRRSVSCRRHICRIRLPSAKR